MARHTYELTDETRKVMSGNVPRIAEEAEVSDKYLHGILAGTETDPFAPFVHYYASSARAGAPICYWDNKLAAIRARYEKQIPNKSLIQCLTEKIESDADTSAKMVDALRDGFIDAGEADRIQAAINKERQTLDLLETHVQFKRELKAVS
jgi:hypothetical protein